MPYETIEVEPLTPTIGAVVHGVDLAEPLGDALFDELHDAWMQHLVLFFRDQTMTPDQHLEFGRRFGPLHIHPAAPYANGNPELMVIHTDANSTRNNGGDAVVSINPVFSQPHPTTGASGGSNRMHSATTGTGALSPPPLKHETLIDAHRRASVELEALAARRSQQAMLVNDTQGFGFN